MSYIEFRKPRSDKGRKRGQIARRVGKVAAVAGLGAAGIAASNKLGITRAARGGFKAGGLKGAAAGAGKNLSRKATKAGSAIRSGAGKVGSAAKSGYGRAKDAIGGASSAVQGGVSQAKQGMAQRKKMKQGMKRTAFRTKYGK